MPAHYAPLPNPHTDLHAANELEAAFDVSDEEEDDEVEQSQTRGGRRTTVRNGYHPLAHEEPASPSSPLPTITTASPPAPAPTIPGAYDFEGTDFDYARPPPGSPPSPTDRALPNEFGNSNGLVPAFRGVTDAGRRGRSWFGRTAAAVLPTHYVQRLGWGVEGAGGARVPHGPVGGGLMNDGVFANVVAKPTPPVRIREGDETYLVPEDSQKEAPPSYAAAQADAVPPYWETTVHAPSSSMNPGDIIIDALPTGSLFSFLWNMLVSISFQFVGFLLTYLLHTTHAAKLGSRAGLGITLIQYGFAMRRSEEGALGAQAGTTQDAWGGKPYFATPAEAEEYYKNMNGTLPIPSTPDESGPFIMNDGTSEWISFLLMTVGWFILLTSLLGFWRVKRWERGILNSQHDAPRPTGPANGALIHSLERVFGLQGLANGSLLRTGFGLGGGRREPEDEDELVHVLGGVEEEDDDRGRMSPRGEYIIPLDPDDPERNARVAQAMAVQARLHHDLRSAGLI